MKTKEMQVFVRSFVVPQEDSVLIGALRMSIDLAGDNDEFADFKHKIVYFNMPHHFVIRHPGSLEIINIADPKTVVAVICCADDPPQKPCERRMTRHEQRKIRRLYPYIDKWPHLLRVMDDWTWEQIVAAAQKMNLKEAR
jgi:hypothetical protein